MSLELKEKTQHTNSEFDSRVIIVWLTSITTESL